MDELLKLPDGRSIYNGSISDMTPRTRDPDLCLKLTVVITHAIYK